MNNQKPEEKPPVLHKAIEERPVINPADWLINGTKIQQVAVSTWKTSAIAILSVISGYITIFPTGMNPIIVNIAKYINLGGLVGLGWVSKDFQSPNNNQPLRNDGGFIFQDGIYSTNTYQAGTQNYGGISHAPKTTEDEKRLEIPQSPEEKVPPVIGEPTDLS